jgi:predicted nucleic acid-binding protein
LNRYLLDTNHLSAYLDRQPALEQRIDAALRAGDRFGICLPVLCEYRAGIQLSRRHRQNLARLQIALTRIRLWPSDEQTAIEFAKLFQELRSSGRMLSQFDLLIAAVVRQHKLTLLTADQDFQAASRVKIENWLGPG